MHAYTLDVGLYIGDGIDGTLFKYIGLVKRGWRDRNKSIYGSFEKLKTSDPRYQTFLEEAEEQK